jgi:hypothetical protein
LKKTAREAGRLSGSNVKQTGFAARAAVFMALAFFVSVCAVGLTRGLPGPERTPFYPADTSILDEPQNPQRFYRTGPLDSYNPDEGAILDALSNMNPSKLDFNPRFFNYSTFFIYQTGAALAVLQKADWIKLFNDKRFYFEHPAEIKKMYLVGRILSVIYGLLTLLLVYRMVYLLTQDHFRAALAMLFLSLTPNWARESVFMLPNVAETFFMTAAVYLSFKNRDETKIKKFLIPAVCAGLAAGCKYPGGTIAILPAAVFFFNSKERWPVRVLGVAGIGITAVAAFILTTPYLVADQSQFVSDLNTVRTAAPYTLTLFFKIYPALLAVGPGILLIFLGAFSGIFTRPARTRWMLLAWLFLSAWVPVVSNSTYMRYWAPVLPAVAVFSAVFLRGRMFKAALLFLMPLSFLYAMHFNILTHLDQDPRLAAAHWVEANIPSGSTIAVRRMHFDMPVINREKYEISQSDHSCPAPGTDWMIKRDRFPLPRVCPGFKLVKTFSNRPFLFGIESFARDLGDLAFTHLRIGIYKAE